MGTLRLEVPITKFVVVRVKYFNTLSLVYNALYVPAV